MKVNTIIRHVEAPAGWYCAYRAETHGVSMKRVDKAIKLEQGQRHQIDIKNIDFPERFVLLGIANDGKCICSRAIYPGGAFDWAFNIQVIPRNAVGETANVRARIYKNPKRRGE